MKILRILLAVVLLSITISTNAQSVPTPYWIDGTHLFDNELREMKKTIKSNPIPESLMTTRAMAPQMRVPKKVGDTETFWTKNIVENKFERTDAILKSIGQHCYLYVEKGRTLTKEAINNVRKTFDEVIYPTDTSTFGSEWKPGIDNDEKITLLMLDIKDGFNGSGGFVGGYFYAGDEYYQSQIPPQYKIKSNEREMFYLDIYPSDPSKKSYMNAVAHEFQHMIHYNHDSSEHTWLNEACSQIAPYLCGFGHANQISAYIKSPDNSLTGWANERMLANYGEVYLWNYYIYNRFLKSDSKLTKTFFKNLVDSKDKGILSYKTALKRFNVDLEEVFDSFCIANFVNNPQLGKPDVYSYDNTLGKLLLPVSASIKTFPNKISGEVFLWSADSIDVDLTSAHNNITINFTGEKQNFSDKNNTFSLYSVLSDSSGNNSPKLSSLKDFAGKIMLSNTKGFDKLKLIVISHGPKSIDDKEYKDSKSLKYQLEIVDSGNISTRSSAPVLASNLVERYSSLVNEMPELNNNQLDIAYTELENIHFKITRQVRNELDNNSTKSLDSVIKILEANNDEDNDIQPLIKSLVDVSTFSVNQNKNTELQSKIDILKSYLK